MKLSDRKVIYVLLIGIIILSSILLYKINNTPHYDEQLYSEVYSEYNEILDDINKEEEIKLDNNKDLIDNSKNKTVKRSKDNVIALIRISKINLLYPIISDTSMENLKIAPSKLWGGEPNTVGNFCVIGHNLRNNEQFSNLDKLKLNDTIEIINIDGKKLEYKVYNIYNVNENDLSCTSQDTNGKKEVTLITCTKSKKKRLVIKCVEA